MGVDRWITVGPDLSKNQSRQTEVSIPLLVVVLMKMTGLDLLHLPDASLMQRRILIDLVECIDFPQRPKPAFQVIDNCPRRESFRAIDSDTRPKMNVMIYKRFLIGRIGEVRFLGRRSETGLTRSWITYLYVPEVCGKVVALLSQLQSNNFMHHHSNGKVLGF